MLCPVCKVDLILSVREGVEIDCCPQCGGIWLDPGELFLIMASFLEIVKGNPRLMAEILNTRGEKLWPSR